MDMKQKTVVIVAVIIVVIAAVFGAQALNDKHDDSRSDDATYYIYLDGMGDRNGWYSAVAEGPQAAMESVAKEANLTVTFSSSGFMKIEEFPSSYESSTGTGTGLGVYVYTSTDITMGYASYFVLGPTISNVAGNILYITYSAYHFEGSSTVYEASPSTTEGWNTTGPFAENSDYTPLSYETYNFYFGGVGESSGWYSASGETIEAALIKATENSGLTITLSDKGWLSIAEYPGSYDSATSSGTGIGIYDYLSTSSVPSEYNIAGTDNSPVISKTASNTVIIIYSSYHFAEDYSTIWDVTPMSDTAWKIGGPFAA